HPAWSPDGQQIVFASAGRQKFDFDIYVMDADGGNVHPLTDNPASDSTPAWSPDGRKIAFKSARAGGGIYVMDANGKNVRRLTFFEDDYGPAWSPDGRRIAFTSLRDANPEIYVMDADGRNQQRLTHHRAVDSDPAWFDPRFARSVAPIGKQATIWGWLKQLSR
ncbi:MAG: DPP IV N-terminal domain-containing protein, partial [Candidatus Poribacteria bacterium]|nr:DPP IV N-terminal domain-containing protein [Candidatus Poribacteria bacterium]